MTNNKLREALEATLDLLWDMQNANRSPISNQAYAVKRKIKAALEEPARNCDMYTTHKEALDAWLDADPKHSGCCDEWFYKIAKESEAGK